MRAPVLAALILAACGDTTAPGFSTGPAITSVSASTSGSSTSADTTSTGPADDSAGSSTSTSTGAATLDVGTVMDFGPVQPPGCKGKVDLLFVISRQGTMVTEQTQLLASFAGFIETIEQKLEGFDVHIMTANPDGKWPGDVCQYQKEGCFTNWPWCGDWAEGWQYGPLSVLEYSVAARALAEHAVDRGDGTLAAELGVRAEEGPCAAQAGARVQHNTGVDPLGQHRRVDVGLPRIDDLHPASQQLRQTTLLHRGHEGELSHCGSSDSTPGAVYHEGDRQGLHRRR